MKKDRLKIKRPSSSSSSGSSSQEKPKIRMKLTKDRSSSLQRSTPSRLRVESRENKPSVSSSALTSTKKKNRFPNFKEIERKVKKNTSSKQPFIAPPRSQQNVRRRAGGNAASSLRFSSRNKSQQQPRGLLGQGGLLSKIFNRRSRKLDISSEEGSTTEIFKLAASEKSEDTESPEEILPFLDEDESK